jgi:hypothetical protein
VPGVLLTLDTDNGEQDTKKGRGAKKGKVAAMREFGGIET